MNVLSLFDGMSCGKIALDRANIPVTNYYASEIDSYAEFVSEKNYPDIIRLGDVTGVKGSELPQIDLILAGSPCQGFSFAGKQLAFDDPRSALFFEFVRILKETKPKYFLLENVKMKKEYQKVITDILGVEPIEINSALMSAQNRKRLYWTNIPSVSQPEDKGIVLKDILEGEGEPVCYSSSSRGQGIIERRGSDPSKAHTLTKAGYTNRAFSGVYKHTEKALDYMNREVKGGRTHWDFGYIHSMDKDKSQCLTANMYKGVPYNVLVDSKPEKGEPKVNPCVFRKLTPIECERLQTVPDNYTEGVSNTQRYKMLGNGWTVDVIAHILSHIPN